MLVCFTPATISQASLFTPSLAKAVEKALSQPTQVPIVTEGLSAACLLLKIYSNQNDKSNNLQNVLNVVFDMDKQVFVAEKFLMVASDDGKYNSVYRVEAVMGALIC